MHAPRSTASHAPSTSLPTPHVPNPHVSALRELLLKWDPIGVADEPAARDEYDCMIEPIHRALREGAASSELLHLLGSERTHHFGLRLDPAADVALVSAVREWWQHAA